MRDESGANCGVSEMAFHHVEFALGGIFPLVKFDTLVFYHLELAVMRSISVDISNNSRILEINDGVVDEESGGG